MFMSQFLEYLKSGPGDSGCGGDCSYTCFSHRSVQRPARDSRASSERAAAGGVGAATGRARARGSREKRRGRGRMGHVM